jgi:sodium transport system permease protein
MRTRALWTIFVRELVDLLRDRRTLFSMIVLPLVAFPVITVVVGKFVEMAGKRSESEATTVAVRHLGTELEAAIAKSGLARVMLDDPRKAVEDKKAAVGAEQQGAVVRLFADRTRQASSIAEEKLRQALGEIREQRVREGLARSNVPVTILAPFQVDRVNVASDRKMSGFLFGTMLGYVVILLMFSGGIYPAIDMTAGEKERKTIEALLASPAARMEIVLGKILATVTVIFVTALLTLASLFYSMKSSAFGESPSMKRLLGNISIDAGSVGLMLLTLAPVALMAGSLMIAISCFARSFKEAQSYLTPLLMLVILPSLLGGLPGMEFNSTFALIPIYNSSQVLKGILQGDVPVDAYWVTMAANVFYAGVCFVIAVRLFQDESVMFRT